MKKILAGVLIVVASLFLLSTSNVIAQGGPCTADFTCDGDVDADDVTTFLSQFGREQYYDPCPDCYDSPCPCSICPYGMVDCGTKCVDPLTDEDFCGVDSACLGGDVCGATEKCVSGTCEIVGGGDVNGSPCIQPIDCLSGYCVDGVCCNAQCAGLCVSCLASDTGAVDGSCSPIIAGTDPYNECVDPEICDGAGGCVNP